MICNVCDENFTRQDPTGSHGSTECRNNLKAKNEKIMELLAHQQAEKSKLILQNGEQQKLIEKLRAVNHRQAEDVSGLDMAYKSADADREVLKAELATLKARSDKVWDDRVKVIEQLTESNRLIDEYKAKDRAFEEATVKNLEALTEILEVLTPFYFHAKALRDADIMNLAPLKEISKCGASALVGGAFSSVIEAFEKWGPFAGYTEKRKCEGCGGTGEWEREKMVCPICKGAKVL